MRLQVKQIAPLTSLRFFAALLVVAYHTMPRGTIADWAGQFGVQIADLGFSAVGFFFVLSGYILATVYPSFESRDAMIRFAVARLARIVPVYIATMLMDLPRLLSWRIAKSGLFAGSLFAGGQFVAQTFMLQAWVPYVGGLNFPSWSVATECFFYLSFPFLLPYLSVPRRTSTLLTLIVACWLLILAAALIPKLFADQLPSWLEATIYHNPIVRLPEFAIGVCWRSLTAGMRTSGGVCAAPRRCSDLRAMLWLRRRRLNCRVRRCRMQQ